MKFSKSTLFLIIFSTLTVLLLLFSQLYTKVSSPIPTVPEKLLEPINAAIDTKLIDELKRAQNSD